MVLGTAMGSYNLSIGIITQTICKTSERGYTWLCTEDVARMHGWQHEPTQPWLVACQARRICARRIKPPRA